MMMELKFFRAMLAAVLLSSFFYQTPAVAQDGASEWSSAPCSSLAIGPSDEISHLQRIFLLGKLDYTIQYKYFSDPQCKLPLYSLIIKGTSETTGVSKNIPDTLDVTVNLDRVLFTLDSPRGAKAALACGDGKYEVGVQRDVTSSGCLHIKPKSACGYDYEIVKIKDGVAIPGFRTADMCTLQGRPTKQQTIGATFIEQF